MSFEYFDQLWSKNVPNLQEQKIHWDKRAKEFSDYRNQVGEDRVEKLLNFFEQKGLSYENLDILDIGCGTGTYALEFAKKAKSVTALDISTQMIAYAKEEASERRVKNVQFAELPWEDIDLDAYGCRKKFDLAVAIMTPAINSRNSLEKMMEASKDYCFMSGYVDRHEKLKEAIEQNILHRKPNRTDFGLSIYCSFNILWLYGIHPDITYYTTERENDRTVEEAFTYYTLQLERKNSLTDEEKLAIRSYLKKQAQNGRVKDTFQSKTAWLFWRNN